MTVMAKPMAAEDGAPTTTQVRNVAGICRALDMLIEWRLEQLTAEQAEPPLPGQAHMAPENRAALERFDMDVADAAIHRAREARR